MALRAVDDHPKLARLKALLECGRGEAMGYLEALWHFCGRFTPQGNIGKYSDADIEAWIEWKRGEPGALVKALREAGWLDTDPEHRLLVHDWHEHADEATKITLKRKRMDFFTCRDTVATALPSSGEKESSGKKTEAHVVVEEHSTYEKVPLLAIRRDTVATLLRPPGAGAGPVPGAGAGPANPQPPAAGPTAKPGALRVVAHPARMALPHHGNGGSNGKAKPPDFEAFWRRYRLGRDAGRENQAARAWVAYDCESLAPDVVECLASYELSRDWANGAVQNADNWLRDNRETTPPYSARWPPAITLDATSDEVMKILKARRM